MDFLEQVIALARENVEKGGRPFATLVVKDNQVIATGLNTVAHSKDPTAHAEIEAIRNASQVLNSESLAGCTLYTTSEPCPMCLGALYWAEVDQIIFTLPGSEVAKYYPASRRHHTPATFYSEYSLPYTERKLPMHLQRHPDADALFSRWHTLNVSSE